MLTAVCCLLFSQNVRVPFKVGQVWDYTLTYHYSSEDVDSTDEEMLRFEVTKLDAKAMTLSMKQKLVATLFDKERVPTSPTMAPITSTLEVPLTGFLAPRTVRYPLEGRVFRLLQTLSTRTLTESMDFGANDDGTIPSAAIAVSRDRTPGVVMFSYREPGTNMMSTNGLGKALLDKNLFFPKFLKVQFARTRMPGGTDIVNCDFEMRLKETKIDKSQ